MRQPDDGAIRPAGPIKPSGTDVRERPGGWHLAYLAVLAVLGGVLTGLVAGLFRLSLSLANGYRGGLLGWARLGPSWRWAIPVLTAAVAVMLARLVVRWVPEASGSGVQRVEAALRTEVEPVRIALLPAKFVGGFLSLGAGMLLGREGPTVQMGASLGAEIGRRGRLSPPELRMLTAATAGAGLAVAFSAPLGGALFVFEEVAHAFRTRLVLATLTAVATAVAVSGLILGDQPVFAVGRMPAEPVRALPAYAALGLLLGVAGVAYNRLVIFLLNAVEGMRRLPPEVKAAVIGGAVGAIGVGAPELIGGGESLNQAILSGRDGLGYLGLVLLIRWFLGPLCYSAGTPGGLFAPLLLVGAAAGGLFAGSLHAVLPALDISPTAGAIVGMSTFFAAVVRAPFTGVVLVVEMTAQTALVVPMLLAAAAALLSATLLHGPPVYDTLRERMRPPS
ncbi:ClC family H(+)/Cl(-) exchange transporter [Dactylosporangium sp. CA-052675]|uniref:ClC family H(+)/Cl(-) exchange transporter n=1 Tax=Dactylosporangium sp. CA-052675 TaxID=3239927 RepID=UPI003D8E1073